MRSTSLSLLLLFSALSAPAHAQWSTDELSQPRKRLAATSVGSEAIFAGGTAFGTYSDVVDIFDAATGTWRTDTLSQARGDLAGTSVGQYAIFAGGRESTGGPFNANLSDVVDIYDSSTGQWTTSTLSHPRNDLAAASAGGRAFFAGGRDYTHPLIGTERVDIYEPATNTWTTSSLSRRRWHIAATSVGDLVLFGGGSITDTAASTVDIYDTQTDTWSTSALSSPRVHLAATSVGGRAFFGGGYGARVDIYDPATGTWSVASLSQGRSQLTATTVGDFALFAGGGVSNGADVVDIYDSSTDTWSTATLSVGRYWLASTSVYGMALFGGGTRGGGPTNFSAAVDIFDPLLGETYCSPGQANSTGLPGLITANGSPFVTDNFASLFAEQLPPGEFGYFLASQTPGTVTPPGSSGVLCVTGNIGRYNAPPQLIQGPSGTLALDLTAVPVNPPAAVLPGESWNFQLWYRDAGTNNFTDAVRVTWE
ncbi:MAG: hypothetical protein GY711_26165 [bacterium]|nr:hypothetical protein [bacterium]